jgi:urocanate hydratase
MTAGSYCYIGPQGIVHGTFVRTKCRERKTVFFYFTDYNYECSSKEAWHQ